MSTNHTSDNWASFRRILEQLLNTTETQTELLKSLLEEGDDAHHLDFIQQLQFDDSDATTTASNVVKAPIQRVCRSEKTPNALKPWTDHENVDIAQMFRYGLTDIQIAEFLGRSVAAVSFQRQRLGLRRDA